jgi:hypothetical protein
MKERERERRKRERLSERGSQTLHPMTSKERKWLNIPLTSFNSLTTVYSSTYGKVAYVARCRL